MSAAPPAYRPVATYDEVVRGEFIIRVYQHLVAAVVAFVAIEALLINLGVARALYDFLVDFGYGWLLILGGFMIVSWLATNAAHDILDPPRQYLGLFGLAFAEACAVRPVPALLLRGGGRWQRHGVGRGRDHRPRVRRAERRRVRHPARPVLPAAAGAVGLRRRPCSSSPPCCSASSWVSGSRWP